MVFKKYQINQELYTRGGIITECDPNFVIVRLRMPAGMITPAQMQGLGEIASRYGVKDLHLTTRQTVELPHVDPGQLEELVGDLEKNGTPLGAEREEVVNVTACMGNRHCKFGIIDSVGLAQEIDKKFFGRELPVKVRIAISSCPNGCESERLNEIGITGTRRRSGIPASAPAAEPAPITAGRRPSRSTMASSSSTRNSAWSVASASSPARSNSSLPMTRSTGSRSGDAGAGTRKSGGT